MKLWTTVRKRKYLVSGKLFMLSNQETNCKRKSQMSISRSYTKLYNVKYKPFEDHKKPSKEKISIKTFYTKTQRYKKLL